MARQARKISETDFYHVIMRGNNKAYIFDKKRYKQYFFEYLSQVILEELAELVAWCIMDNHVHLVIKCQEEKIGLIFKRINTKYAMYYHRETKTVGHVFESRYKSEVVESDESLLNVIRYVHNNPVKAKMVEEPDLWQWSSYSTYLNRPQNSVMTLTWALFGKSSDQFMKFHQQEDYNEYLEIKEDRDFLRETRAQEAISEICNKYGIVEANEIYQRRDVMREIIELIKKRSHLSGRKIAQLIGVSESTVRKIGSNE